MKKNQYSQNAWWCAIVFSIAAGWYIRILIGLQNPSLWGDEASWFFHIQTSDTLWRLRAPAYMLVHRLLFQSFLPINEYTIRLISIISGFAFLPIFTFIVHKLFQSYLLTFIGALLASFHISLSSFTYEFKPYMLDTLLHALWFYSAMLARNKPRAAVISSGLVIAGCLFSYSLVPLLAFQLVYIGYLRLKNIIGRRTMLISYGMTLSFLAFFLYAYIVTRLSSISTEYWGDKYGVFLVWENGMGFGDFLVRLFAKISTYLSFPLNWFQVVSREGGLRGFSEGFGYKENAIVGVVFVILAALRCVKLKWDDPRLVPVYLLGGYTLAGVLRIWPLGYFRTNIFLFLYSALIVLLVFQVLDKLTGATRAIAALTVLLPSMLFTTENPIGQKNHGNVRYGQYLPLICAEKPQGEVPVIVDLNVMEPISRYYLQYDEYVRQACDQRVQVQRAVNLSELKNGLDDFFYQHPEVWLIIQGSTGWHREDIFVWVQQHFQTEVIDRTPHAFLMRVMRPEALQIREMFNRSIPFHEYSKTTTGWSTPESWGTWTEGEWATLSFDRYEFPQMDLELLADVRGFTAANHPEQIVDVLANGIPVGTWTFAHGEGLTQRRVALPADVIAAQQPLTLAFHVKFPASPLSLGLSEDPRQLGLGLQSMMFRFVIIDAPIVFSHAYNSFLRKTGWSNPEPWGTWTDGEWATLSFDRYEFPQMDLELLADVRGFTTENYPEQIVDVLANGVPVGTWTFAHGEGVTPRRVALPAEVIAAQQPLTLAFHIKFPASPLSLGLSEDPRQLGLAVQRMLFRVAAPADTAAPPGGHIKSGQERFR